MNKRLSITALVVVLTTVVLTLLATPGFAAEGGGNDEGSGKLTIPDNEHDQVGLILLGITGLFVLAAGANAVKQYRGTRPQADGKIRWR